MTQAPLVGIVCGLSVLLAYLGCYAGFRRLSRPFYVCFFLTTLLLSFVAIQVLAHYMGWNT